MNKLFSVLICTIDGRERLLDNLLECLQPQLTDDVEVLIEKDNKKISTGQKRNILLNKATGKYIAFIDDDDLVSNNYISLILKALKNNPDCVGFQGQVTWIEKNNLTKLFIHSIEYNKWFEKDNIYYRMPNHLNPVKRELALKIMFPNISQGEDFDYSQRLKSLLKSEVMINDIMYYYYP